MIASPLSLRSRHLSHCNRVTPFTTIASPPSPLSLRSRHLSHCDRVTPFTVIVSPRSPLSLRSRHLFTVVMSPLSLQSRHPSHGNHVTPFTTTDPLRYVYCNHATQHTDCSAWLANHLPGWTPQGANKWAIHTLSTRQSVCKPAPATSAGDLATGMWNMLSLITNVNPRSEGNKGDNRLHKLLDIGMNGILYTQALPSSCLRLLILFDVGYKPFDVAI